MKILVILLCIFVLVRSEVNITVNGYLYFVSHPLKLNWFQSLRYCRYIDMHLIDLTTPDEINRIATVVKLFKTRNLNAKHIEQLTNFWTSGCDHGDISNFYWMSNGQKFGKTNWAAQQPDNLLLVEHCVEMQHKRPYRWNDEFCSYKKSFICRDRIVRTVDQIHQTREHRSSLPDSEKPVRVANASRRHTA